MDEKKFIELYQQQKESGLTVKEFCANQIIAPSSFYYWRKKIEAHKRLPDFVPLSISSAPTLPKGNFTEKSVLLPAPSSNNNAPIEIEFPNKTILRINSELDLPTLKALIHLNE